MVNDRQEVQMWMLFKQQEQQQEKKNYQNLFKWGEITVAQE